MESTEFALKMDMAIRELLVAFRAEVIDDPQLKAIIAAGLEELQSPVNLFDMVRILNECGEEDLAEDLESAAIGQELMREGLYYRELGYLSFDSYLKSFLPIANHLLN